MTQPLAWGIISTGRIAQVFAGALEASTTGKLLAVGSRTPEAAEAFGAQFNVPRRYGSYDALLADPEVQAVYIATPHPMHAQWAVRAADAGKHLLVEKPLTLNYAEAQAVVEAAARNDVFLMEAFMYRCHPQTAKLVELLREKVVGDVRIIEATFSFRGGFQPEARYLNNALGGGGIMDLGCYCASLARLAAGAALGLDFAEPLDVKAVGHVGVTNVDDYTTAVLRFPEDIIARLNCGVLVGQENVVRIYGTEGSLLLPVPWFPGRGDNGSTIIVRRGEEERVIDCPCDTGLYTLEADMVARHLAERRAPSPAMTPQDSLGNMRVLDRWRAELGVVFESERPEAWTLPVDGKPLAPRPGAVMPYHRIDGLEKPVSRLVMGAMAPDSFHAACVLYDEWIASGGNAFDTAYVYGGGFSERLLGQWVHSRGIREQVVILDKGAHTPLCDPEHLTSQLFESLDRLGTDYLDIYMMHRDNPEVPASEFIDVMNEHQRAGRMRVFGVSNWTLERVDAANAYARAHGLRGISAVSNNFALARMIDPVWAGCLGATDPASRAWFTRSGIPLMSWSSQARGFFTVGDRGCMGNAEVARCWYSEDNFRRLDRARELAARRGVSPLNIALAYVLNQPFAPFALVGPLVPGEIRTLLPALRLTLTPEELRWLNLEA